MMRIQEPPNSIQVEFTEGCNLRCNFCGLQGIRAPGVKDYKLMTPETAAVIGRQAKVWNSRMEIAMHGEPTMHPDFIQLVGLLRDTAGPKVQIMMTSNGGGLLGDVPGKIRALFDAGLDILALDEYQDVKIVSKIRARMSEMRDLDIVEYPTDPSGNPHKRWPRSGLPFVSLMADPSVTKSSKTPKLTNHCGAAFPKNQNEAGKRCHRPFREMSIRWDGNVAVCCNDWRGEYKCGNVLEIGMEAVWQSAAMDAARRKLYRGQRDFGPCDGCDARSYRVGLLPDKLGKDEMPEMDEASEQALRQAMEGPSYAVPFKREWE